LRIRLPNNWVPRWYQRPLWDYLERGGRTAVAVWHRRAGKDEVALHRTAVAAHERPGNYWHMLPQYEQARKAIWDAVNPHTSIRRIDEAFPAELRKSVDNHGMKITFKSGAIWQVVGSDNFNSLVGSPPVGVVYSEWSLANPVAHAYLSPILRENHGWALWIYTARGYNHGFSTFESAKANAKAFAQLLTVDDTQVITREELEEDRREKVALFGPDGGDALWRQEWFNDWSAANVHAVLGSAVERAERDGRIVEFEPEDAPVYVSGDLGFRDTTAWWFWQPKRGGFDVIDYTQGIGMDADDWIDALRERGHNIAKVLLPHDARVKTFQSKHSALERFVKAFGTDKVAIVPQSKKADQINAARRVIERCRFNAQPCTDGLLGLRSWSFGWDEEKRIRSKEPLHNWASHPADAFCYGAQYLEELAEPAPPPPPPKWWHEQSLDELWAETPAARRRI
jgi:hypothetical protein